MTPTPLQLDTIHHGDCITTLQQLPEQSVDLIFADPPYHLQLQKELVRPDLTVVDAVDDAWDQFDSHQTYADFTRAWLTACRRVLKETGTIWVMGSYHNIYRVGAILQDLGFWFLNDVLWVKTNPMPNFRGVRFTNAHETLLWCKKSQAQKHYTFNYHAMKTMNDDKQMRSDWHIPLCTGSERLMEKGKKVHSTQKPEALLYRVILSSSLPGDVVLDPFFGTGTTGAVAKKLGRHYIGIEQNATYIKAAEKRLATIPTATHDAEVYGLYPTKRNAPRVPFAHLLEQGYLTPGQQLYFNKKRNQAVTVLANGSVRMADGSKGSIHQIGVKMSGRSSCNGWEHWYYLSDDDTFIVIDQLRAEIRRTMRDGA